MTEAYVNHGSRLYLRTVKRAETHKRSLEIRAGLPGVSEIESLSVQRDVFRNQPVVRQVGCREGGGRFLDGQGAGFKGRPL